MSRRLLFYSELIIRDEINVPQNDTRQTFSRVNAIKSDSLKKLSSKFFSLLFSIVPAEAEKVADMVGKL